MQTANRDTVLGDFSDIAFDYFGTTTQFLTSDDRFVVRTGNANGETQDFVVAYTFGIEPLQQYLVEIPGGRMQALTVAWDTRPKEHGGQRWFHLYPDEYIGPDDPLHWTGRNFNWNYMCAECHSTNVVPGYDQETDSFRTTYAEISVGCEACHGPGSPHLAQASAGEFDDDFGLLVDLDDKGPATWTIDPETGIAERSEKATVQQQPESCGRCHARRSVLTTEYEYGKPLTDTHMPSLLEENLYFANGRIQDEVYVYGSFLQSRMYRAGVTCSDCHNPHSGELVTGSDPNAVCAQCHLPSKFVSSGHGGGDSDTSACVDCHMPARTYMGVDDRRDHSFRIPDADLVSTHYGTAIAAGRAGSANQLLIKAFNNPEFPAIVRATLLTLLAPPAGDKEFTAIQRGLGDPDPLVRIAALRALQNLTAEYRMRDGSHLLRDPVRGVRIQAALTYVDLKDLLPIEDARAFAAAADEYRQAQLAAASRPEALANLGEFESLIGSLSDAARYFERALKQDPDLAMVRHAYGLLLVRAGRSDDALTELRRAAELEPANSRYTYVLGVALNSLGQTEAALRLLRQARKDFPVDFDIAWALVTMLRDSGDISAARIVAKEMALRFPGDTNVDALHRGLYPNITD